MLIKLNEETYVDPRQISFVENHHNFGVKIRLNSSSEAIFVEGISLEDLMDKVGEFIRVET